MKTLFLFTVLFVLLAFAFKSPEESAWEFAKTVGSNVIQKINEKGEGEGVSNVRPKPENKVVKKFEDIRKELQTKNRDREPIREIPKKPSVERKIKKQPKPKISNPAKKLSVPQKKPEKVTVVASGPETSVRQVPIQPAPRLPARPVPEVAIEADDDLCGDRILRQTTGIKIDLVRDWPNHCLRRWIENALSQ